MEVDTAGFRPVILSAQAEVDHHDPAIADDHVRGRQIAVDDPGPMEATDDLADPACDLHRRQAALVEDILRGRTVDELHDDLVLDQIDVVQDRHCDSGRSGFRHETCFVADPGATRSTAKRWTNPCGGKEPWPTLSRARVGGSRGSWRRRSAPMPTGATRARSATSRVGTSTPTSVGAESVAGSSAPRNAGPANVVARRWDPIVSSRTRSASGRTSPSGTKRGNGSSIFDDGWLALWAGLGRRKAATDVLSRSRRFEECADLGCGFSGRPRVEVWRQAAGIPRFEQPSLQQDDRGTIPLAPDRTAGGLEDLVHC